jgi:hypothetical protein
VPRRLDLVSFSCNLAGRRTSQLRKTVLLSVSLWKTVDRECAECGEVELTG